MIIIPDIHGRTFWKDAVAQKEEGEKIIFLGDYLDPYLYEWFDGRMPANGFWFNDEEREKISGLRKNTIANFKEVIEYKKANPDDVILLIGNHDCGYAINRDICECRSDHENFEEIRGMFNENEDLFQLAYEITNNGEHIIFSHAGIHKDYATGCFGDECNEDNVVKLFNDSYTKRTYGIMDSLARVSRLRGGWSRYGSIVWADVREWSENYHGYEEEDTEHKPEFDAFQIFGHSQQEKDPVITSTYACLDCRRAFRLDDTGNITPITPERIIE